MDSRTLIALFLILQETDADFHLHLPPKTATVWKGNWLKTATISKLASSKFICIHR